MHLGWQTASRITRSAAAPAINEAIAKPSARTRKTVGIEAVWWPLEGSVEHIRGIVNTYGSTRHFVPISLLPDLRIT